MRVKYLGCLEAQIKWGNNDDPRGVLKIGEVYEVERSEVRTWHTKLYLKNIKGKFNSVCFEIVKENTKKMTERYGSNVLALKTQAQQVPSRVMLKGPSNQVALKMVFNRKSKSTCSLDIR